jgi:hypothetical protein
MSPVAILDAIEYLREHGGARRSRGTATATPPNALATSCTRG